METPLLAFVGIRIPQHTAYPLQPAIPSGGMMLSRQSETAWFLSLAPFTAFPSVILKPGIPSSRQTCIYPSTVTAEIHNLLVPIFHGQLLDTRRKKKPFKLLP